MNFIAGYIAGVVTIVVALTVLVLISKLKVSHDYFKRK